MQTWMHTWSSVRQIQLESVTPHDTLFTPVEQMRLASKACLLGEILAFLRSSRLPLTMLMTGLSKDMRKEVF